MKVFVSRLLPNPGLSKIKENFETRVWEEEYQSTCLLPQWSATLEPTSSWKVELSLGVRRL